VHTECILTIDADSTLLPEELDFGFRVWRSLPNRLLGFSARAHVYDESRARFAYSSRWANDFSIVLLDAAFFHKWYAIAFTRHLQLLNSNSKSNFESNVSSATSSGVCTDLHFNFLFALLSRQSPIKLTQRKRTTGSTVPLPIVSGSEAFGASQRCFQMLVNQTFARIPLRTSQARLDPLLFKDPVSALRKRYRRIEQVL
jgi:glucuronyl/N-acetylglucosaminyl transferase EXT1